MRRNPDRLVPRYEPRRLSGVFKAIVLCGLIYSVATIALGLYAFTHEPPPIVVPQSVEVPINPQSMPLIPLWEAHLDELPNCPIVQPPASYVARPQLVNPEPISIARCLNLLEAEGMR